MQIFSLMFFSCFLGVSLGGGSSFGGVLNLTKTKDNSQYAFSFEDDSYMEKMINYFKYKMFLDRFNSFVSANKTIY